MGTTSDFFDSKAAGWEESCYPEDVRARLVDLIPEFRLASEARVLDIGTGPGVLLPYIRKGVGDSGRVCAFDLSLPMAREAGRKPLGPGDLVLKADVHHIPFRDGVFDNVICFAAFPHFQRPVPALAEMVRVAAEGAVVVIAHLMSRQELADHHGAHSAVASHVLPSDSRMKIWLEAAGLSNCDIIDAPGRYLARGIKQSTAGAVFPGTAAP
ncbi:MAG: class I SAM-dependent methyltransferase [Desulfobacterales bacterium]|jgi:ubiquinone/menaquinone biosynthesis C-methylase UbiE